MKLKTILIVDDDIYIGDMIEEVLSGEGYAAARAYSGTEALMYLSSNRPDLILLDLMLPGLSGEELLPLIKGITQRSTVGGSLGQGGAAARRRVRLYHETVQHGRTSRKDHSTAPEKQRRGLPGISSHLTVSA